MTQNGYQEKLLVKPLGELLTVTVFLSNNIKLMTHNHNHKMRSTFLIEKTLLKLLCKRKDRVATEDKNYIVEEIDFSNCNAVKNCCY